jgi:hypothetical protein
MVGPWDLVAFGGLYIGAFILAADTGLRMAPEITKKAGLLSKVLASPIWGFAPFVLLTISGIIFIGLQTGLINSRSDSNAEELEARRQIGRLQSDLKNANNQIADLMAQVRPRVLTIHHMQIISRELELPQAGRHEISIQQDTGCSKCANYAAEFEALLKTTWAVGHALLIFVPEISGRRGITLICKKGDLPPFGIAISSVLSAAEVPFSILKIDHSALENTCVIYIGPRDVN